RLRAGKRTRSRGGPRRPSAAARIPATSRRRGHSPLLVHGCRRGSPGLLCPPARGGDGRGDRRPRPPGGGGPACGRAPEIRPVSARLTMDGAVARLTLERPEALNALNRDVAAALEDSLGQLERTRDVSVVVLGGRGRAFCAGNDIAEMPALSSSEAEALSRRWQDLMDRFARLPQVTIAAVQGYALGGGCMLAAAQDLRIAETGAKFGLPEITLGFNPSYGIARLLDVVGGGHARELLLTGRTVDGAEALRLGP